ncbi:hypothetical protein V1512DRAFT_264790 [Lipomyces arxii]|uniref:uncharacterized protein n=1 Tax=Lipomyces arxii TaxID=56418 RepID=UPI0034CFF532
MPATPPRPSGLAEGKHTVMLTPPTPRHGPRFDQDYCSVLEDRKFKDKNAESARNTHNRKVIGPSESVTGSSHSTKFHSRTRTKSGAAPVGPMLTPRQTPHKRTTHPIDQYDGLEDAMQADEDLIRKPSLSHQRKGKAVARILFPVESVDTEFDETKSANFTVYRDTDADADQGPEIEAIEDDPFTNASAKKRTRELYDKKLPDHSKKGMTFLFRGKKVFRSFVTESEFSDDEFAIAPIKPRVLFPSAKEEDIPLESSQSTASAMFDETNAESMLSQDSSLCSQAQPTDKPRSNFTIFEDGESKQIKSHTMSYSDENLEEEETDIEDYYST